LDVSEGFDGYGLDKAARRAAQRELERVEAEIPVALNPALPGFRLAFDWQYFGVEPEETGGGDG
jgi:hypothetical protein